MAGLDCPAQQSVRIHRFQCSLDCSLGSGRRLMALSRRSCRKVIQANACRYDGRQVVASAAVAHHHCASQTSNGTISGQSSNSSPCVPRGIGVGSSRGHASAPAPTSLILCPFCIEMRIRLGLPAPAVFVQSVIDVGASYLVWSAPRIGGPRSPLRRTLILSGGASCWLCDW